MSLLSQSPIITASEGGIRRAELETNCYSNIGMKNVRLYRLNTFCLIKSGDGGLTEFLFRDYHTVIFICL